MLDVRLWPRYLTLAAMLAAMALLAVLASSAAHASTTVQNSAQVDDTAAIQAALDAESGTDAARGTVLLQPESTAGCYTISSPGLDMPDYVTLDSTAGTNARWCISRNTIPTYSSSLGCDDQNDFRFMGIEGADASEGVTVKNGEFNGRHPTGQAGANESPQQNCFVDFGFLVNPAGGPTGDIANDIVMSHVAFTRMYGVCFFSQDMHGFHLNDVSCNDPTKGGIVFAYGTRDGWLSNSEVSESGDDAFAVTSASGDANSGGYVNGQFSRSENIKVTNGDFRQETNDGGCGTVCLRGAKDVNMSGTFIGKGSGAGSLNIREADSPPPYDYHSVNINVNGNLEAGRNEIRAYLDTNNAVDIRDTSMTNTKVSNNNIYYGAGKCGIETNNSNTGQLITAGNNYTPNTSRNVC